MLDALDRTKVVDVIGYSCVTRGDLVDALSQVADKVDWKLPIDAFFRGTNWDRAVLEMAIRYFTGSEPRWYDVNGVPIAPSTTDTTEKTFIVRAAGYYGAGHDAA